MNESSKRRNNNKIKINLIFYFRYSIVDSGTPLPTVPTKVYSNLKNLLLSNCSKNSLMGVCTGVNSTNETLFDGICFDMNSQEISEFPTLEYVKIYFNLYYLYNDHACLIYFYR